MKRQLVISSKSEKEIYRKKWQNIESSSDSESDDGVSVESTGTDHVSGSEAESPTITCHRDNENQIPIGTTRVGSCIDGECMYRAALEGDWQAAEILLERDPTLATDYVTEEGDRALHVAAAMKKEKFVKKLVEWMNEDELALLDGRGYTACCYVAISGVVKIARFMIEKNPNLVTTHDQNNLTPLHKAALRGNKEMLTYLLKSTKIEDLSKEEWFDLLLVTIQSEMYDVATDIMEKDGSLATMANKEGTALHLLARQERSDDASPMDILFDIDHDEDEKEAPDFGKLAKKLWAEMQKLEKASLLQLIKKPHILHEAAKEGHVDLVTMLTRTYPQLMWDTDSNGHTIFHIAVTYRQYDVFNLIYQVKAMVDSRTISQDQNGNNILHLAAKSAPLHKKNLPPAFLMQRELALFKAAKEILPLSCLEMRNKDGLTPKDMFSKEHKRLLKNSKMWMRNTADSYMLVATILLTVVFFAAFTVPGGYDSDTGQPILAKRHWFKVFRAFEVLGLIGSVVSIVTFRSIMASRFAEDDFLSKFPTQLFIGFEALLLSLVGAFSAFISSTSLVNPKMNGLVWFGFCSLHLVCIFWFYAEVGAIIRYRDNTLIKSSRSLRRNNLFNGHYPTATKIKDFLFSILE